MTVEVEILSSNVEVLEKQPPLELLPSQILLKSQDACMLRRQ